MVIADHEVSKYLQNVPELKLPQGEFIVDWEGKFLSCNRVARQILNIDLDCELDVVERKICDYYYEPEDRDKFIKNVIQAEDEGRHWEGNFVAFHVPVFDQEKDKNNEVDQKRKIFKWVIIFCHTIRNNNSDVIGFKDTIIDITDHASFHYMLDLVQAGVYELDKDDKIVKVNDTCARLFGHDNIHELTGKKIEEYYADPSDSVIFKNRILNEGFVKDERVALVSHRGKRFIGSVSSYGKFKDGEYCGREGTLMDITIFENYMRIKELPVGTYVIRKNDNDEDIIWECNDKFAVMFGYNNAEEMRDEKVVKLYESEEEYNNFIDEIDQLPAYENDILDRELSMITRDGRKFRVSSYASLVRDRIGKKIGRIGFLINITSEVPIRELRNDIGKALHTFSATLDRLSHACIPMIKALGEDPFLEIDNLTISEAANSLVEPKGQLRKSLDGYLNYVRSSKDRMISLGETQYNDLCEIQMLLKELDLNLYTAQGEIQVLFDIADEITNLVNEIGEITPDNIVSDLRSRAMEIIRIYSLYEGHGAIDKIKTMETPIRLLREMVFRSNREIVDPIILEVNNIVELAKNEIMSFANFNRIVFKEPDTNNPINVRVIKKDIVRALANLIHNAVKYTWSRFDKKRIVEIKIFNDRKYVFIQVENFGVPIKKHEIDSGLIYEFGYRGELSDDRGRFGTGIGLADAKEVAQRLGGDVYIESHPASPSVIDGDYIKPFITTATLKLPIHNKRGLNPNDSQ